MLSEVQPKVLWNFGEKLRMQICRKCSSEFTLHSSLRLSPKVRKLLRPPQPPSLPLQVTSGPMMILSRWTSQWANSSCFYKSLILCLFLLFPLFHLLLSSPSSFSSLYPPPPPSSSFLCLLFPLLIPPPLLLSPQQSPPMKPVHPSTPPPKQLTKEEEFLQQKEFGNQCVKEVWVCFFWSYRLSSFCRHYVCFKQKAPLIDHSS